MHHYSIILKRLYRWGNNSGNLWKWLEEKGSVSEININIVLKVETIVVVLGNWWLFGEYHEEAEEGQDTYLPNIGCETEKKREWVTESDHNNGKRVNNYWISIEQHENKSNEVELKKL